MHQKTFFTLLLLCLQINVWSQETEDFAKAQFEWVENSLKALNVEEKIAQTFMVAAYSNKTQFHIDQIESLIENQKIGGLIFFQGTPAEQVKLTNQYQTISSVPLLIAMDAEWGLNMRLKGTTKFPRQLMLGAIQDNDLIEEMGREVARQCTRIGVHVNFAPVVDVNNNPNNPVINDRSFGENKYNVAKKGIAYMQGMEKRGVMACAKHFPGHGDTDQDSHKTLPQINHNLERLNDIELYPFRELAKRGVGAMMIAHLAIPALEPMSISGKIDETKPYLPVSLSKKVVTKLLKGKMNYEGLVFTDALNMKGVADYFQPGMLDLQAFLAGNDVLLFPEDVAAGIREIKRAIEKGMVKEKELDARVRKILKAKYRAGLNEATTINPSNLDKELNTPEVDVLQRKLVSAALTLARNDKKLVPINDLQNFPFASVSIGETTETTFTRNLDRYSAFDHFQIGHKASAKETLDMISRLDGYKKIVVAIHKMSAYSKRDFGLEESTLKLLEKLNENTEVILVVFGNPYSLKFFDKMETVLMSYEDNKLTRELSAQLLFGGIPAKGKLPVSASPNFQYGQGVEFSGQTRLRYGIPEEEEIKSGHLGEIDSLVQYAIGIKAMPGCQILVAQNGNVIYDKSFGYHTYDKKIPVKSEDLYDIASITKIVGTLPAVMHLYEEKKVGLDETLGELLPFTKETNKDSMVVRDILIHQAGLANWIPFYQATLPEKGKLNEVYRAVPDNEYNIEVARNVYMQGSYVDTVWHKILESDVRENPKYRYSDLGYYFFKEIIEQETKRDMDDFLDTNFYYQLGMNNTTYNANKYFEQEQIVPSEKDEYFRLQTLQGHVHDMGAAMMGGVQGHAGVFSNANDLAKMMQMFLNKGKYGSQRYLEASTIDLFTAKQVEGNRRGLGFDKPEMGATKRSPTAHCVSEKTFGHSGFTGTCVWVDPEYDLIYVFLSNRTYPTMNNHKLVDKNIRTRIQEVIYRSILGEEVMSTLNP